ncbi:MAG TPA: FkbM family methyltransferase [Actinomycetota bacterium]|nr:FkbM family methyltransferase [Actinomycetota bacterium]
MTTAARAGLRRALERRRDAPVGTPLRDLYAARYARPTRARATTFWGDEMDVVLPELVSCEIHRYGVIEPGLSALFVDVVRPGTVVFDAGAHLGYYSLLAASLGARVHAFEPSRQTLPLLRDNAAGRVRVVPAGLWSAETTLSLTDFGSGHSALDTFVSSRDESAAPRGAYDARVTTVDAYVAAAGDVPDVVKVDAEGAELEVLRGAASTMTTARPLVTVEVGDTGRGPRSRDALDFAATLGYAPFDVTPDGVRPHRVRDEYEYGNVLLAPEPAASELLGRRTSPRAPTRP